MFILMLFQMYGNPPMPDYFTPFYVERGHSQKSCEKRGKWFVEKFYGGMFNVTFVCAKERRVKE